MMVLLLCMTIVGRIANESDFLKWSLCPASLLNVILVNLSRLTLLGTLCCNVLLVVTVDCSASRISCYPLQSQSHCPAQKWIAEALCQEQHQTTASKLLKRRSATLLFRNSNDQFLADRLCLNCQGRFRESAGG